MNVDRGSSFGVLVAATITIAFYGAIFHLKAKNKILRIALRVFALILIGIAVLLMTIHIHFVSAILIVAMICTIFTYSKLFAKREGLIRHNINEAKNLGKTLVNDAEKIILGHRFAQNQATIYELDAARFYPKSAQTATVYKLDIIPEVISFLSNILCSEDIKIVVKREVKISKIKIKALLPAKIFQRHPAPIFHILPTVTFCCKTEEGSHGKKFMSTKNVAQKTSAIIVNIIIAISKRGIF